MILSDTEILAARDRGEIVIDPFDVNQLGGNSYDVRLGPVLRVYDVWNTANAALRRRDSDIGSALVAMADHVWRTRSVHDLLDCAKEPKTIDVNIPDGGIVLVPGILYLASTVEYTETHEHVVYLDGKSSIGRLGIAVHLTAGRGDVGFCGHFTLEMSVVQPVRVYAGMPIAQLTYYTVHGAVERRYQTKPGASYLDGREPPESIIRIAEQVARQSPCAKSKRGAVVFHGWNPRNGMQPTAYGVGFNGQPEPFRCTGTERCRKLCGQLCEHAEGRALRDAAGSVVVPSGRAQADLGVDLVHVKIGDDGKLVAGGPPSCWQCSRAILDCGFIAGVWLYEGATPQLCGAYLGDGDATCPQLTCVRWLHHDGFCDNVHGDPHPVPAWRRYSAEEFHATTLRNCGVLVDAG